jgi:Ca2+-binding RTX toxin-like protein
MSFARGGQTSMAQVNISESEVAFGLLFGRSAKLGSGQFTYSRPVSGSAWPTSAQDPRYYAAGVVGRDQPFDASYSVLTNAQWTAFARAMKAWDALIAPNFTEVAETGSTYGEIRVAFTGASMGSGVAGYAMPPSGNDPSGTAMGDIWLNSAGAADSYSDGGNYALLLHEIGHALGLKHPFEAPNATSGVIKAPYDNERYTVMSYTRGDWAYSFSTSGNSISGSTQQARAATPMVLDILAVQQLYGAALDTAVGDDVYRFVESSAELRTIYDRGGNDTIDLSNYTRGSVVDLTPGSYSSIGLFTKIDQIEYWTGQTSAGFRNFITGQINRTDAVAYEWRDNLGIAFDTIIENVTGGSGNDVITGNAVNNRLDGGMGDDTISGGGGDDLLITGGGNDVLRGDDGNDGLYVGGYYSTADLFIGGAGSNDQVGLQGDYWGAKRIVFQSGQLDGIEVVAALPGSDARFGSNGGQFSYDLTVTDGSANGVLTIYGVTLGSAERLRFDGSAETDTRLTLYGGRGADILIGGSLGDVIHGGEGKDALTGDAGADVFQFDNASQSNAAGFDTISDFNFSTDKLQLADPAASYHRDANVTVALSTGSVGAELTSALANRLTDHGVALVTGAAGSELAGHVFAVVDMDGVAGFDAAKDLVVDLGMQRVEDLPNSGVSFIV